MHGWLRVRAAALSFSEPGLTLLRVWAHERVEMGRGGQWKSFTPSVFQLGGGGSVDFYTLCLSATKNTSLELNSLKKNMRTHIGEKHEVG